MKEISYHFSYRSLSFKQFQHLYFYNSYLVFKIFLINFQHGRWKMWTKSANSRSTNKAT